MSNTFIIPKKIVYGNGALKDCIPSMLPTDGKALIITGNVVKKQPCFKELTDLLNTSKIGYAVFSDIFGEPTDKMVEAGLNAYKESGCSYFLAIGGGSVMDLMKAVAVLTVGHGNISDYLGKEIKFTLPFMVAVPTTAGTGSEATKFTAITDTKRNIKMLLNGIPLIPDVAVLDSVYTVTAPSGITAHTALDALTHAIEAYTSRKAQPLTDTLALSAIKRICTFLPTAYKNGKNLEARSQLLLAALEAGICINNSSVTLVHGMSRPIGALFHVPHGLSNAMLLPKCLAFACEGAMGRFAQISRFIGLSGDHGDDDKAVAGHFLQKIEEICHVCEIPSPTQYNVPRDAFFANIDKMADDAIASGSPSNTIRSVTKADIVEIYSSLW